jgi:uncharacterized protein (TIGR03118 family)
VIITAIPAQNQNLGPTGVVSTAGIATTTPPEFQVNGTPSSANFIFDTLNGTIAAWNGGAGGIGNHGTAVVEATTPGAIYTGLAIATVANGAAQDLIYAVDNASGAGHSTINVFNSSWTQVIPSGGFTPQGLPSNAVPYNIQQLNGFLYVTYQGSPGSFAIYDLNGNFLKGTSDSHLLNPWGITIAPLTFGQFGGDILVGNRSNGQINAFDPNTLAFLGTLTLPNGQPIAFPGLWALAFRNGTGFDPNTLYFDAGLNGTGGNFFTDGLFGTITVVPEPASVLLLGLGLIAVCGVYCRRAIVRQRVLGRDGGH